MRPVGSGIDFIQVYPRYGTEANSRRVPFQNTTSRDGMRGICGLEVERMSRGTEAGRPAGNLQRRLLSVVLLRLSVDVVAAYILLAV